MGLPEETERNREIYNKYVQGRAQRRLAEEYGLTQQRISEIVGQERQKIDPAERQDQKQRSFEFLNDLRDAAYEISRLVAAPVAVGKDGNVLYDPVDQTIVRDYSGQLRAMETAARMDDRLRALLGIDAPVKTETEATVRYVVEGIDPNDLK